MGTKFTAHKEVTTDYYPPKADKAKHVPGIYCHCNPYESVCEVVWKQNEINERIGVLVRVCTTHRILPPPKVKIKEQLKMPDFDGDKIPRGTDDLVTTMKKAENRMQQLVRTI